MNFPILYKHHFPIFSIYLLKVSKNYTSATCQLYSKLTKRHQNNNIWCFFCYLWTYFAIYSTVNIVEFKQIDAGWAWGTVVSDNNFFSNFERYIGIWAGKICWATVYIFIFICPAKGCEQINFHDSTSKKISWTLDHHINVHRS